MLLSGMAGLMLLAPGCTTLSNSTANTAAIIQQAEATIAAVQAAVAAAGPALTPAVQATVSQIQTYISDARSVLSAGAQALDTVSLSNWLNLAVALLPSIANVAAPAAGSGTISTLQASIASAQASFAAFQALVRAS
jgi:hypothetical protein